MSAEVLETALALLQKALRPFPIEPGGRRALIPWTDLLNRQPSADEIRSWFGRWPDANLAIVTGAVAGIDVIEFDRDPSQVPWPGAGRTIPGYCVVATPRGGRQFFLPHTVGVRSSAGALVAGVAVRGDGGYVLITPSVVGGEEYLPVEGAMPLLQVRTAGTVPGWLQTELLRASTPAVTVPAPAGQQQVSNRPDPKVRYPELIRVADVRFQLVIWLWPSYIPIGKLTLLEGNPQEGKTFIAIALAAIVSRGGVFPGETNTSRKPAAVVYMSSEDGVADTLRPRLEAAGADLNLVHVLRGYRAGSQWNPVTLRDCDIIGNVLATLRPALLVVDPLQAYLGADTDLHRSNETRPVLEGLCRLAERYNCAVLAIRHLSKADAPRAIYRGLGSIDITAVARSVLLAGQLPQQPDRRAIVQIKNNLAPLGPPVGYSLVNGKFSWTSAAGLSASDLLAPELTRAERTGVDEAKDFLQQRLADGPVACTVITKEAEEAGISMAALRQAKEALGVKSQRVNAGAARGEGYWAWSLPGTTNGPSTRGGGPPCAP